MPDINAGKITRFEDGGVIRITPAGGSELVVLNVLSGSFGFVPPVRATLEPDMDRGVLLDDIRSGDEQPGSVAFDIKATLGVGSDELYEQLVKESTDGYQPKFEIVVDIPDYAGATTGRRYTFHKAVRSESPSFSSGDQYDTIIARFINTRMTGPVAYS